MLDDVVKNDRHHDARKRAEHEGGQHETSAVVVHAQTVHQRHLFGLIGLEQTTQPVGGGKGGHTKAGRDPQRDRQEIEIMFGNGLGKRDCGI